MTRKIGVVPKIFLQALTEFPQQIRELAKFERTLKDKRLSSSEKKILECWLLLRDKEYEAIIDQLTPLNCEVEIVESQRLLILGIAFNNKSEFKAANELLKKALDKFPASYNFDLNTIRYRIFFNLFVTYKNLNQLDQLKLVLRTMSGLAHSPLQRISFEICRLSYANQCEDTKVADKSLGLLQELAEEMSEYQKVTYLQELFQYSLIKEQFDQCSEVLSELATSKKYFSRSNYKFMKQVLNSLVNDQALYLYETDFQLGSELYWQVKTLLALEACQTQSANLAWSELNKIKSHVYLENFCFKGPKCLFKLSLNKFLSTQNKSVEILEVTGGENKLELLYQILLGQTTPLSKDEIYRLLWGELPVDKMALNKLERIASRLRTEKSVEIISRKGCYFMKKKDSLRKVA
ncbi:MAG: hypothetical protein ACOYL6_14760 [Bacteriovoracaceae bacterium]